MSFGWKKRYITLVENIKVSTYDRPFLSMVSDEEMRIENHQGIVEYCCDRIMVKTLNFFINIYGENLFVESMTKEEINIMGKINKVEFENG